MILPKNAPRFIRIKTVKSKYLALILLIVIAIMAAALAFLHFRPVRRMNPPVDIQDGKTIDFSSGKPVVKDSVEQKAIIDAAVKEMDEAVKDVTFGPPPAKPPEKKATEPAAVPAQK